jgi:multidrug efflux pump subunit AcrB
MTNSHNSEKNPKGIINWFIHNHVAANILMFLFIIGGIISVKDMRTETFPSIDPKIITVSVAYPGATPYEIADSITSRIEEELVGIEGVKRVASTAIEGSGIINVELLDFSNADDVYNEVETAVNSLIDFPPVNAQRPIISKMRVTPNVMTLAIHGNVNEYTIKHWAETIEDELRQISGVALTQIWGIRDYQISVEIPESSLRQYKLTFDNISHAIRNFSEDTPAGSIESNQGDILLRVQEKRYTGKEFENIVVRTLPDGSTLRLKDIGTVIDGFSDVNLISKFNNERAAFIDVKRSNNDDTLEIANRVKKYLSTIQLPAGVNLSLQHDETINLNDRISLMARNGIIGFMLVFLILLLFLDLKLAFWTSSAIPISFLGGLMIMQFMGYSLNMISLFALIIVMGIVVDDGIVTGESIFDAQEKYKKDPNAVLKGVLAVVAPVTIGVTTTMAAFAPLVFSTGTLGQVVGLIPVVVISILLVSLIEAYFILPSHLSNPQRWSKGVIADIRDMFAKQLKKFTDFKLIPSLRFALRWRYATVAAFIAIAILTSGLIKSGTVRFLFFPQIESNQVTVTVNMPIGTPFDLTTSTMLTIEEHINEVKKEIDSKNKMSAFESTSLTIGQIPGKVAAGGFSTTSSASNIGQIKIQMVPSDFRDVSSLKVERMIRKRIENLPNIETLEFQSSLIKKKSDIKIELTHANEEVLNIASESLKIKMNKINGIQEVADSFEEGKNEYIFKVNEEGLAVGLTPLDLGKQLRAAYFGLESKRFQRGSSEMIVYVRYPKNERESLTMLNNTRIRLPNGKEIPLGSVADIKQQRGYSQILTVNGRKIVNVSASADSTVTTPNEIITILQKEILPELQALYPGVNYSFEGESREQKEDLSSLGRNMLIALILIYVLLGAQLRSYIQPFVIMAAIPFGIIGAVLGHFFLGYDLTFISLFGIVALTGVVINDSVILVDYLNTHLNAGTTLFESALIAVKRRFRPILLTTLSTSLGLLPILLETSMQAQFLIPMAVSLAVGILFATFIILFLVPCLMLIVQDIKDLANKYISQYTS